jgi:hypothetical protein
MMKIKGKGKERSTENQGTDSSTPKEMKAVERVLPLLAYFAHFWKSDRHG